MTFRHPIRLVTSESAIGTAAELTIQRHGSTANDHVLASLTRQADINAKQTVNRGCSSVDRQLSQQHKDKALVRSVR
jgi:hypothetical protein